jgi:hypothetical protein
VGCSERGEQESTSPTLKVPRQCPLFFLIKVLHTYNRDIFIWRWKGCIIAKFDLTLRGLHVKHGVQHGNLGTNSAFILGQRKTTENLDGVGRSQDLSDANWILASGPPLNNPYLAVALLKKKEMYIFVFTDLFFCVHALGEHQTVVYNIARRIYAEVIVRVTLRLAVCRQSDRLGVKPLETHEQIYFF